MPGSYATRIGYAGDDCPRAYFPTVKKSKQSHTYIQKNIINYSYADLSIYYMV